jgi:hypothetical protein
MKGTNRYPEKDYIKGGTGVGSYPSDVHLFGTLVNAEVNKFLRSHEEDGASEEDMKRFVESVIESALNCGLDVYKSSRVRVFLGNPDQEKS